MTTIEFAIRCAVAGVVLAGTSTQRATWIVRLDGIGPVQVGMRIGAVAASMQATARTERIEPGESCGQAYVSAAPTGVSFMVEGDTIVRVDIDSAGVKTVEGIGVGDRETDVLLRYKGLARKTPHPYEGPRAHYIIVDRAESRRYRMLFETDGTVVRRYRVGRRDAVDLAEGCA